MRTSLITGLSALALATFFATPAAAAELGGGFNINGGATVVSDYRFRGISQTWKKFAVQGTISVSHESGIYATVWGSSIDDYVAAGSDQEMDLILGYKHDFSGTVVDFGVLYYFYPGNAPDTNTDFFEPYLSVSHTFGPVTGKISAAYAPKQKGISVDGVHKEDNLYLAGDLSVPIKDTGLAVAGHFGHSFGPSWLTIGDGYSDWNLGVTYTTGPLTIGLQYVDTDDSLYVGSKNVSKAGVVGSIGVSF
jgi:uncharacterized protein (TIGR02001 family)